MKLHWTKHAQQRCRTRLGKSSKHLDVSQITGLDSVPIPKDRVFRFNCQDYTLVCKPLGGNKLSVVTVF